MTQEIVSYRQAVAAAGGQQMGVCVLLESHQSTIPFPDSRFPEGEHQNRGDIS